MKPGDFTTAHPAARAAVAQAFKTQRKTAPTSPSVLAVKVEFPGMRTRNPLNNLGHWRKVGAARKTIRDRVYETLIYGQILPDLPVTVKLHRIGKQLMDKHDGLPASMKPVIDGIADAMGVDDADERIEFERPTQERGKEYGVVVTITARREGKESNRLGSEAIRPARKSKKIGLEEVHPKLFGDQAGGPS